MKIYIDAGHGGSSIGATYKGRKEQDDCLRLALKVEEFLLKQKNVEVKLSRRTDINPLISNRCKEANAWGADYFLSIHRNAYQPEKATGAETWVYSKVTTNGETFNKAARILELVCEATGYENRGIKKGAPSYSDYGVNSLSNMSSTLFEFGFIDNTKDNEIFDKHFNAMAEAIAQGLIEACGGAYVFEKTEVKPVTPPAPAVFEKQTVQIGSFEGALGAETYLADAIAKGLPAEKVTVNGVHKIILGDVDTQAEADKLMAMAKKAGFNAVLIPLIKVIPGDIDGDGKVTAADARVGLRDSVDLEKLTKRQKRAADVDGDGKVTAADAREILRKSVGLDK